MENEPATVQRPEGQRPVGDEDQPSPAELLGDIANRRVIDVWRDIRRLGLDPRIVNAR